MAHDTKAEIIRHADDYRAKAAAIRADETLSPLGKRKQLEALYSQTKPVVDDLKRQMQRSEYTSKQQLERRLFGLPAGASASDAISYRDAVDRVAKVRRPDELGELMERAAAAGDDMLLRAAAGHAWNQSRNPLASDGWDGLLAEYGEQDPAAGRELQALAEAASSRSATAEFGERMAMEVSRPKELDKPEASFGDNTPRPGAADRPESLMR